MDIHSLCIALHLEAVVVWLWFDTPCMFLSHLSFTEEEIHIWFSEGCVMRSFCAGIFLGGKFSLLVLCEVFASYIFALVYQMGKI